MDTSSIRGARILITGITGFVGRHLARRLTTLGAEVFGLSRSAVGARMLHANVLDGAAIRTFMDTQRIEACVHLAGVATVEEGRRDPARTFLANVQGTVAVLECARAVSLGRVIISSTSQVYGAGPTPHDETAPISVSRPYEVSRACADLAAQSYAASFNMPVLIPRFVNTYGPGDTHLERLIPRTIRSALRGESPTMWGGDAQREYLYIDDAVEAFLRLLAVPWTRVGSVRVFNIGTERPVSVETVIRTILDLRGLSAPIDRVEAERQGEIPVQRVSTARARDVLGWAARTDLSAGLEETIARSKDARERISPALERPHSERPVSTEQSAKST